MEKQEEIKLIVEDIFRKMGFNGEVGVAFENDAYAVTLSAGKDSALLIGYHGETLNSLQVILSLILYRRFNETLPLLVDVDGYRRERIEKIKAMASHACDKSRFLNMAESLPPMSSFERRVVHLAVAEVPDMQSESVGEGRERHVVINPKGETKTDERS